jgi:hypothetical protein
MTVPGRIVRSRMPPRRSDRGQWEMLHFAIQRTDTTLRLCLILLVAGSPYTILIAILIHRLSS